MNTLWITVPAAVIPSVILLWYFYSRDKYPEPPRVVFATFVLGVLTVIPVLLFAVPVMSFIGRVENPLAFGASVGFLAAAIPEEFFKFLVIYYYCMRHSEFDEPMDGLVYGVTASLGFATLENVLYVSSGGLVVAIVRAVSAVPMHASLGAVMGYYCGQAKFQPGNRRRLLFLAWFVPMLLHGFYDMPVLAMAKYMGIPIGGGGAAPEREFGTTDALVALGAVGIAFLCLVITIVTAILLARKQKQLQMEVRQANSASTASATE